MSNPAKVVKKVKAYPFPIQLKLINGTLNGQVVKLAPQGFLAEIPFSPLQPGDRLEISFELPALHQWVTEQGKVIKLYNQWTSSIIGSGQSPDLEDQSASGAESGSTVAASGPSSSPAPAASGAAPTGATPGAAVQLVEIHFQTLTYEHKQSIMLFLRKAGAVR